MPNLEAKLVTFETSSGSRYEIMGNKVRRTSGSHPPTPYSGPEGQWREFYEITVPVPGEPVLITWSIDENSNVAKATATARVTRVDTEALRD